MSDDPAQSLELPTDGNASGRSFGTRERELIERVLQAGTLNCTRGSVVKELEQRIADRFDVPFARCVSSGSAAVHCAIAAIDPGPGDEIITTPITDMGAIAPILYQAAVPVFADVDPLTWNITPATVAARITERTKAVVVTHLFGEPADMTGLRELCARHDLPLIEDAAQAFLAEHRGALVGTLGDIGCFSLQQGKHITSGEGGFVLARDEAVARRMRLFSDKAWGYGDPAPDHYFLALNYRLTELQGAVALAQFERIDEFVEHRERMARRLVDGLASIDGIAGPKIAADDRHTFWRIPLRVDGVVVPGGADRLGAALQARGVACAPRYTRKLAFECAVLRDAQTFGSSGFPLRGAHLERPVTYSREDCPGALRALEHVVVLPINERYRERHVDHVLAQLGAAVDECRNASSMSATIG